MACLVLVAEAVIGGLERPRDRSADSGRLTSPSRPADHPLDAPARAASGQADRVGREVGHECVPWGVATSVGRGGCREGGPWAWGGRGGGPWGGL